MEKHKNREDLPSERDCFFDDEDQSLFCDLLQNDGDEGAFLSKIKEKTRFNEKKPKNNAKNR